MKIGVMTYGFVNWGGGIDLIRYILSVLISIDPKENIKITLILPRDDFLSKFKRLVYPIHTALTALRNCKPPRFKKHPGFSEKYLKETFSEFESVATIVFCGSGYQPQLKMAKQLNMDLVLPCIELPESGFELPWVGYIYDFQHVYMPHLFSKDEIDLRNRKFDLMLSRAKHIIVNAKSVAKDARNLYPDHPAKVHVLPFSPCPQMEWLSSGKDVRINYEIDKPYFMICNQFWRHKDHETAFRAMAKYVASGGKNLLVCTGSKADYLSMGHYDELMQLIDALNLSDKIKILGHVPKLDQIALMKMSEAVVQPTLFEGGPGGGASYDAISLGVPVIASDIPVNMEINCGSVTYFSAGHPDDLAQKMLSQDDVSNVKLPPDVLWAQGLRRRRACGKVLADVFAEVVTGKCAH